MHSAQLRCTTIAACLLLAFCQQAKSGGDSCSSSSSGTCRDKGNAFIQLATPNVSHVHTNVPLTEHPEAGFLQSSGAADVSIVSYNLYWWNVRQNNNWQTLWSRIRREQPFDLIGFQECENVEYVLQQSGLSSWEHYLGPKPNPAPLAWNARVFQKIGGPGNKYIASDKWGNRHLTWVRLLHKQSGAKIFFANTHGPLNNCGGEVGKNWVAGVLDNKQDGDIAFMTGDFNCWTGTEAINALKRVLPTAVDGGIDMILTNRGTLLSGGKREGSPSDHPLVKASFRISASGSSSAGNNACDVGSWPDKDHGLVCGDCKVLVDRFDTVYRTCSAYCGRVGLQCVGAWEEENDDCNVKHDLRCDQALASSDAICQCGNKPQSPGNAATQPNSCDVDSWPDKDNGLVCGDCKVLVDRFDTVYKTCDNYCSKLGRTCVGGWEEKDDTCSVLSELGCKNSIDSSDAICQCGDKTTAPPAVVTPAAPSPSKPTAACREDTWPDKDQNLICGKCKVLVDKFNSKYKTCAGYCGSMGRQCVGAWEESDDTCTAQYTMSCTQKLDSSDAICQCSERVSQTPVAPADKECYGVLSNVARNEGNSIGQKISTSTPSKCMKSCDDSRQCNSFTLCPKWGGCWLKDKTISSSQATTVNADCKTYYKKVCDGNGDFTADDVASRPALTGSWAGYNMKITHYWDCSGQGCDAVTLKPWDKSKYISPPGYGPQDPSDFAGGAWYGEKMWLTGAASDALSQLMGPDDGCCGEDGGRGGCGKCALIQVSSSIHPDWTAVVMKKNRCPPWSTGCGANEPHFDVAVPGFDDLRYSTANICGNPGTGFINKPQSEAVAHWYRKCGNVADCAYMCDGLEPRFRKGCKLFASWGWTRGDPSAVKYRAVPCPTEFVKHVSAQFGPNGAA